MASKSSPPLPSAVVEALRRGDTAEAVRLMRGVSGWAPNTAHVPAPQRPSAATTASNPSRPAQASYASYASTAPHTPHTSHTPKGPVVQRLDGPVFSSGLPPLVIDALQRGEKLQAIKLMRELTGVGLKEAKDAVEASPHAAARSGLSPGEVPRTGRTVWAIVAAALVAWLVYVAMRSPG